MRKEETMINHLVDKDLTHSRVQFTRREFLKLSLISSGGLSLTLAGCAPGGGDGFEDKLALVEDWYQAVIRGDSARFEQLHTESVTVIPDFTNAHFTGRQQVLKHICIPNAGQTEVITAFGNDQAACLLINDVQKGIGMCYLFSFDDNLIDRVYEYWGEYIVPIDNFGGSPSASINEDFSMQSNLVGQIFERFNRHEVGFESELFPNSVIMYVPNLENPLIGPEAMSKNAKTQYDEYPEAEFRIKQIFMQGNLVCTQVAGENMAMKSFCFVNVFKDGEISEIYEYFSRAELV
jgi:ketosteroid isomerase-like protein